MSDKQLDREVTELVAEIVEMPADELWEQRGKHFVEELGIDSMLALEILAALEKRYRIEIPEENVLDLVDLEATIALVQRKLDQVSAS